MPSCASSTSTPPTAASPASRAMSCWARCPTLLSTSSTDAIARQQQSAIWAGLRSLGHWSGEVVERRRNGDPCALHLSVFTVPDPDGAVRYRVLMVSDITEQRLQRERLERQAHFDELTRLPNRARLTQLLGEALARQRTRGLPARGLLHRPRPLQGDQRAARPRRRRPRAGRAGRAPAQRAARARHLVRRGRAPGWRRVRAAAARRHGGRSAAGGGARAARDRAAVHARRAVRADRDDGQRGRHRVPDRPQRPRHAAAPRRPRDVQRQAGRPQRLSVLRSRAQHAAPKSACWRSAACRRRSTPGAAPVLPAEGRHAARHGARRRGAAALGAPASTAWCRRWPVPAADRAHRPVRARRRLGARTGARSARALARTGAGFLGQRQRVGTPPAGARLRAATEPNCWRATNEPLGARLELEVLETAALADVGLHVDAARALPRCSACALRSTTSAPAIPPSPT